MAKIDIRIDAGGYLAVLGEMKAEKAIRLVDKTFPRVAKDVRAEIVRRVRARWPKIPAKFARARVTINNAERRLRVYGAGPSKGKMFIRPRWLDLEPKVPAWTGIRRYAPKRAFAATPLTAAQAVKLGKKNRTASGRHFAMAGKRGSGFQKSKAVIFERVGGSIIGRLLGRRASSKIRRVSGPDSMGDLLAKVAGKNWAAKELQKRMAGEAKRRLDARIQTATRRKSRQRA